MIDHNARPMASIFLRETKSEIRPIAMPTTE